MQLRHSNEQAISTLFYTTRLNRPSICHLPLLYMNNSITIFIVFKIVFKKYVRVARVYLLVLYIKKILISNGKREIQGKQRLIHVRTNFYDRREEGVLFYTREFTGVSFRGCFNG
jgi:hypothetical protein